MLPVGRRQRADRPPFNAEAAEQLRALGYDKRPRPAGEALARRARSDSPASSTAEDSGSDDSDGSSSEAAGMDEGCSIAGTSSGSIRSSDSSPLASSPPSASSNDDESSSSSGESPPRPSSQPRLSLDSLCRIVDAHSIEATSARISRDQPEGKKKAKPGSTVGSDDGAEDGGGVTDEGDSRRESEQSDGNKWDRISERAMRTPTPMLRTIKASSTSKKPGPPNTPQQVSSPTKPIPSPRSTRHRPPVTSATSPSPRKPSILPTLTSPPLKGIALSTLAVPPFFSGLASGSRILRQRLNWIHEAAQELASDPTRSGGRTAQTLGKELARVVGGRSEEWWRSNSATYRDEVSLGLEGRSSFLKFEAGADGEDPPIPFYQAFVEHVKLCGHDDPACRLHRALVVFFAYRAKPGDPRMKLPKGYDLGEKDVRREWREFSRFYEHLAKEKEWVVDVEGGVLDRGGVRGSSVSPTKRKGGASLERGLREIKSRRVSPIWGLRRFVLACSFFEIVPLALATHPSLLSVASQLQEIWPTLTFADTLILGNSVVANAPLLRLSNQQRSAPYGRLFDSNLGALTGTLFGSSSEGVLSLEGVEGVPQRIVEGAAILETASALGIGPVDSLDDCSPLPFPNPPLRIICTKLLACRQCGGVLRARKKPTTVWILLAASVERGACLRVVCANKSCGAIHHPDVVKITHEEQHVQSFDVDADYLKIGRALYAHRSFAKAYAVLLETNHVASSSYASLFSRLYRPAANWELTSEQVWRAFVLHTTLELAKEAGRPFATSAHASSEEVVRLALEGFLSSKTIRSAMEHSCPDCSRYARRWKAGPAGEEGETATYRKGADRELQEHTTINTARIIKLAVMDGIAIGHTKCAYPPCKNDPTDYKSQRFCSDHQQYNELCGVFGCDRSRLAVGPDEPANEACDAEEHQQLWRSNLAKKGRDNLRGYQRMIGRWREEGRAEGIAERGESGAEGESASDAADLTKPRTMWSYGRIARIQALIWACGCPAGWEKLYSNEDVPELLDFLDGICDDPTQLPSILAYDNACKILAYIAPRPELHHWLRRVQLIVDSFHFAGHSKNDVLCRTFCDPAPLDGSAPDLVIPLVQVEPKDSRKRSRTPLKRSFRRAFNTEAAEQLNSWLTGFASILRHMRADNHDFLLHVLLRRRFQQRSEDLEKKHKGVRVG